MSIPAASGVGFAIANGEPIDIGSLLHFRPGRPRRIERRQLFATVEPLQPTERGREVASVALRALKDGFAAAADQPIPAALGRAFADANAAVREENRHRPSDGPDRRVYVGASAVVLDGRELVVAQVPPTQAAVVQEGQVYAFPALASWSPRYQPSFERLGPDPEPLGRSEHATVDIFRTIAAPGDLIVLCASAIPIAAARDANANGLLPDSAIALLQEALRPGDPDRVVDHLDHVIERYRLDDAHAACFTIGRLHALDPRIAKEYAARIGLAWGLSRPTANPASPARARANRSRRAGRRPTTRASLRHDRPDPELAPTISALSPSGVRLAVLRRQRTRPTAPLLDRHREQIGAPLHMPWHLSVPSDHGRTWVPINRHALRKDGAPAFAGGAIPDSLDLRPFARPLPPVPAAEIHDHTDSATKAAIPAGPWKDPEERGPGWVERARLAAMSFTEWIAPPRPERGHGRARRIVPGALSIERHRAGLDIGIASDVRSRLPRASLGPIARPVLFIVLAILIGFSTFGYIRARILPDREAAAIEHQLSAANDHISGAERATERTIVFRELAQASEALEQALIEGADEGDVATVRARLDAARDRAQGIVRLKAGEQIGGLPAAATGPHIVQIGSEIYIVSDALYRFDRSGSRLVRTLAPGDRLGEAVVGNFHYAARDSGSLLVTDGSAAYTLNSSGTWSVRPLTPADGQADVWAAAPIAGYDDNLYLLDQSEGRILRFAGEENLASPHDWTNDDAQSDLRTARDLVVDGEIHVLAADGRILTFYQGLLNRTYGPPPGPDLINPIALSASTDGSALYLVDGGDETTPGRVFKLDLATGEFREFIAEPVVGAAPFQGLQDAIVDETTDTVVLIAGDILWQLPFTV